MYINKKIGIANNFPLQYSMTILPFSSILEPNLKNISVSLHRCLTESDFQILTRIVSQHS